MRLPGLLLVAMLAGAPVAAPGAAESDAQEPPAAVEKTRGAFQGMDGSINEEMAERAGRPARAPYIDTESMGDLWNTLLLLAGAICGFVLGRYWDHLWGRPRKVPTDDAGRRQSQ